MIIKNIIKNKNFWLPKNYTRYEKNVQDIIVHLKKINKFTSDYFLIEHVVFVLIVKNVIKNENFFLTKSMQHKKKILGNEIVRFKKIY